jgi:ribosome maturation factor RimP
MGMDAAALCASIAPLVEPLGLSLHDLELGKGLVRVTVLKEQGVSLEDLTAANHAISAYLDEHEPMSGRYTLEVTSPGVERKLRNPGHFAAALGEMVRIKTTPEASTERRVEGVLEAADADSICLMLDHGERVTLRYDQIDRARTVYSWGPQPKPSPSRGIGSKDKRAKTASVPERMTTS